jgi:hypothetical protein
LLETLFLLFELLNLKETKKKEKERAKKRFPTFIIMVKYRYNRKTTFYEKKEDEKKSLLFRKR